MSKADHPADASLTQPPDGDGASHSAIQELQRNVACPACGYNLRGLRGAVVQCPECGETCDVVKLITRGWTKPWYRAPHFNLMAVPAAVVHLGLIAMMFASAATVLIRTAPLMARLMLPAGMGAAIVLLWCYFMYRTWRVFASLRGPLLALLVHVVVVGYLVGCFVLLASGLTTTYSVVDLIRSRSLWSDPLIGIGVGIALLVLGAVLLWASRRGERFVAGQCIARYLAAETQA